MFAVEYRNAGLDKFIWVEEDGLVRESSGSLVD